MTDMAVMGNRQAEEYVTQSEQSTVDDSIFLHPDRIRFDNRCLQIDGKDEFVFSGTFHYFRTPRPLWRDRLTKLKAAGFNCVETYVPWNWHERTQPDSPADFSKLDMSDLEAFLSLTDSLGLYTIVRPGPYICAEWSGGGFSQWLMLKRPSKMGLSTWLQSDESEFIKWCKHWYKAVAKVVAPHQIWCRKPGTGGVILWQLENEYNRVKWIPKAAKTDYLEQLAVISRQCGIEVPFITCWTSETRNVKRGPLNGVVDMVNSYPRWQIERGFGRLINQQLKSQSGKPLVSGELQGGWYSGVGGLLSWQQDGVAPVQTQNITLYALQRGFCALNFYMAVGGTNLDDWAARGVTTTYDFAAAIGEDGTLNERYERYSALAEFIKEHGAKIARAKEIRTDYTTTDSLVKVALRRCDNGDRYFFVRTEDPLKPHYGGATINGVELSFVLEPFGSMVYYLPAQAQVGRWLPQPTHTMKRQTDTLLITPVNSWRCRDNLPRRWASLEVGQTVDDKGYFGRHPVYYRLRVNPGDHITVNYIGKGLVNGTDADRVAFQVGQHRIEPTTTTDTTMTFVVPAGIGGHSLAYLLYESMGLHHHTNAAVEKYWRIGLDGASVNGERRALQYAVSENKNGLERSAHFATTPADGDSQLLCWMGYNFHIDKKHKHTYFLHFEQPVSGFIYMNGYCVGRTFEQGPQHDFYLPECWVADGNNHVVISTSTTLTTPPRASIIDKYQY